MEHAGICAKSQGLGGLFNRRFGLTFSLSEVNGDKVHVKLTRDLSTGQERQSQGMQGFDD